MCQICYPRDVNRYASICSCLFVRIHYVTSRALALTTLLHVHDAHRAILEEHREDCEKNSLYIEADIAKKRLEELWAHEETRRYAISHPHTEIDTNVRV